MHSKQPHHGKVMFVFPKIKIYSFFHSYYLLLFIGLGAEYFQTFNLFSQSQKWAENYYLDSSLYNVTCYDIHLKVVPDSLYISGNTTIWAKSILPIKYFFIQLNSTLKIDSILIEDKKAKFNHDNHWIKVFLTSSIPSEKLFYVKIFYKGYASSSSDLNGLGIYTSNECKIFYTLSEPFSAMDFFPCKQWVTDKADSLKINITTTKAYLAVANGILKKVIDEDSIYHTFCWVSHYPIAYYLIGFVVGNYKTYHYKFLNTSSDSILFENYHCYSEEEWNEIKNTVDKTTELINFFENITGIPYPFYKEKYSHVVAPIGGGMENQTITILHNFDFTLVAHELAHSWFGNLVTCSDWQNIWINEGFATYLSFLALEKFYPTSKDLWLSSCLEKALKNSDASIFIPAEKKFDPHRIFDYSNTYMKGAYFLHTLRFYIGSDSLFFYSLNKLLDNYAYSNASIEDYKTILNEVTGKSWDTFFQQWFYGKGYPIIHLTAKIRDRLLIMNFTIKSSSNDNTFTSIKVPIVIKFNELKDTSIVVTLQPDSSSNVFLFPSTIKSIQVDPEKWLMARYVINITQDSSVLNSLETFPNPFEQCFHVVMGGSNSHNLKTLCIYDFQGKELLKYNTYDNNFQICPSNISQGTYLLVAKIEDEWYYKKIFKK